MASPMVSGTSTPSAFGYIDSPMPRPKPIGTPLDSCSPLPLLCRQPHRSTEGHMEEMRCSLERLEDSQTRVEALLRQRGGRDLSGTNKNTFVNQQSVVVEPVENGRSTRISKTALPANADPMLAELFPDPSKGKPFELEEVLKAMYLKQDRLEQRVSQTLDTWQHKVVTDVSEKVIGKINSSLPFRTLSARGKRERHSQARERQSQAAKRRSGGDADPLVQMQHLQSQMVQFQLPSHKRDEKILKKLRESKDPSQAENGTGKWRAPRITTKPTKAFEESEYDRNPCVKSIAGIVNHPGFDGVCALMIILNSVLIGVAVEETVRYGKEAKWMEMTAHVCNSFFLVELIMRMIISGKRYFLSESWTWNTFDFILVLFSIADVIMTAIWGTGASSVGSGMKTIKMLRIVRIFRVFRFFRELSLLALMIADSIKSLCWALLMLTIIIYVFAICFTQSCADFKWENQDVALSEEEKLVMEDVRTQFGSLPKTIYFLVLSMLGGISWGEVSDTLFSVDALSASLFLFYIFFCLLAVLNIITGVFVDNAVETARTQRDYLALKERQIREKYVVDMQNFFEHMDEDESGTVTLKEMLKYFTDERTRNMFAALGIDPQDMERLFLLLDDDNSGEIHMAEFLEGCLRLKGEAKSIDVHHCLAVTRKIMRRMEDIFPDGDKARLPPGL